MRKNREVGRPAYYYYASDQVNSTRIVTDGLGNVAYSAAYDPYGGIQKTWEPTTYTPTMKFSGKERDAESQLDYFGARYYASLYYRWISPDPMVPIDIAVINPQAWNLYSYVRNNPITNIDPAGLYIFENGTSEQQRRFRDELSTANNLASIRYYAELYGKEGEKNGVTVRFDGTDATIENDLTPESKPTSRIAFSPDIQGKDLVIAIAHEGSHMSQWRAFVFAMYLEKDFPNNEAFKGSYLDPTSYANEVRAYEVSVRAVRALGLKNLILTGFNIIMNGRVDVDSLNSLLARSYGLTPTSQGKRFSER